MIERSLTSRQKQAISTKEKIFNTVVKLLKEVNFEKITIRKICNEANISVGTFYLYFKSKQHILWDLYKDVDKIFIEVDINSREGLDSLEKIKELIKIELNYITNIDIKISKEVYSSLINFDNEFIFSEKRYLLKILNEIIKEGQNKKEIIDDISSKEIVRKILKCVRGEIFDWLINDGNYDIKKEALRELSFYLNLFKTDYNPQVKK